MVLPGQVYDKADGAVIDAAMVKWWFVGEKKRSDWVISKFQCHFSHKKFHMISSQAEPKALRREAKV
jgi:hypothetical protein